MQNIAKVCHVFRLFLEMEHVTIYVIILEYEIITGISLTFSYRILSDGERHLKKTRLTESEPAQRSKENQAPERVAWSHKSDPIWWQASNQEKTPIYSTFSTFFPFPIKKSH